MTTVLIRYDPIHAPAWPDGRVDAKWKELVESREGNDEFCGYFATSSELFIMRARVGRVEGEVDQLVIQYLGVDYEVDGEGMVGGSGNQAFAKEGFCDRYMDYLIRIVK